MSPLAGFLSSILLMASPLIEYSDSDSLTQVGKPGGNRILQMPTASDSITSVWKPWAIPVGRSSSGFAIASGSVASGPLPKTPIQEKDVCPFECCTYGEWTAKDTIRVYFGERDTSKVAFTLVPGDTIDALTGNQYVLDLGLLIVTHPIDKVWNREILPLSPGDSVWLTSSGTEGEYPAWYGGHELVVPIEWWWNSLDGGDGEGDVCRLVREADTEWWVRIRAKNGRVGWIWMNGIRVDGSDGCS